MLLTRSHYRQCYQINVIGHPGHISSTVHGGTRLIFSAVNQACPQEASLRDVFRMKCHIQDGGQADGRQ